MLSRVMNIDFFLTLEAAVGKTAIPIAISVLGTIVLFILARIAMRLYWSGDFIMAAKKLQDLDPKSVRLILSVENRRKTVKELHSIFLARRDKSDESPLALLIHLPIVRNGDEDVVRRASSGEYYLVMRPNRKSELVLEFVLPERVDKVFMVATDEKGRRIKAPLSLDDSSTQLLEFRRDR